MKTVECDKTKLHGMPLIVSMTENAMQSVYQNMDSDAAERMIKGRLAELITDAILKSNLCEFTRSRDPNTFDTIYRCRAFLLTETSVKELRETGQI